MTRQRRQRLGQHFLRDERVLDRIIDELPDWPLPMLEVGPGDGALTARLAVLGRPLAAVELDPAMAHVSRRRLNELRQPSSAIIIEDDILDIDPAETLAAAGAAPPWGLVGNLPYAITAPLLRRFLAETPAPPEWMLIMVQHEVAQRIAAAQGKRSLLSVSVQFYAEAEYLFAVDRESFNPPPKVRSAVVRLDRLPAAPVDVPSEARFFEVVRAGFRTPRKQLHNSLSQGIWLGDGDSRSWLEACEIDPMRRAQTLSLEEWARLAWWRERSGAPEPPPAYAPAAP